MLEFIFRSVYDFFSSWYCIAFTMAFIFIFYDLLLRRESGRAFRINIDRPSVRCLECGKIQVYYDPLSCMAGAFRKKHRFFVSFVPFVLAAGCVLSISRLLALHTVTYGLLSMFFLMFLFSFFVTFHVTACRGSMSNAAFFLISDMVSNVVIDTDLSLLMIFCGDSLAASVPVCLEDGFDPFQNHFRIFLGFPGMSREKALCCSMEGGE